MIHLVIVEDHLMVRESYQQYFAQHESIKLIGLFKDATSFLAHLDALAHKIDVLILDLLLPDIHGLELLKIVKQRYEQLAVLLLSSIYADGYIISASKSGADGYLIKNCSYKELEKAIVQIHEKGMYYTQLFTSKLKRKNDIQMNTIASLKPLEIEFIHWAATDLSYAQIADKMHKSVKTIDMYRANLFIKFDVKSRIGMVMYAIENGVITLNSNESKSHDTT